MSFSGGELDPILHDRATLERFQSSLKTGRNVIIGKQGTILTRFSRFNFIKAKFNNAPIKIYCPPNTGLLMECGFDPAKNEEDATGAYIRLYDFNGTLLNEYASTGLPGADLLFVGRFLPYLQFQHSGDYVYIFMGSGDFQPSFPHLIQQMIKVKITNPYSFVSGANATPQLPFPAGSSHASTITQVTTVGYEIDYAFTMVIDGQETESVLILSGAPVLKKPVVAGEKLQIDLTIIAGATVPVNYKEMRVYSRPKGGSSFGFLGKTNTFKISGGNVIATYTDTGGLPDYTQGIQTDLVSDTLAANPVVGTIRAVVPGTGVIYQQRLLLGNILFIIGDTNFNQEAILASRPAFQTNFYRDFPYSATSALNFKAGSSGKAKVLRMVDYNGLVVFTSIGVYVNTGVLGPDNIILTKRGGWIIDERVPPLIIPDGLFFIDKLTGGIRQLTYSNEVNSFVSADNSIFSNHLFRKRTVKSWAFQDGIAPLVTVTFSDGTFATFTYNAEQQMKAWTRHDSVIPTEQVEGTGQADLSFFVTNKGGNRYIEGAVPRYISPEIYATNPEADKTAYGAFLDSMVTKSNLLNNSLVDPDFFSVTPVVSGDWEGQLTLTCGTSGLFTSGTFGAVGTTMRFFDTTDESVVDLVVVTRTNNNTVTVEPSAEFPAAQASHFRLYQTFTTVTGLTHLEGEEVGVLADGYVISSPYNDNEEDAMDTILVTSGTITLPRPYAIINIGRPIVADVKTLNITTAEQSPTTVESLTVNKLYVRTFESRGIYAANDFPENAVGDVDGTSVDGMQSLDHILERQNSPVIGNRPRPSISERIELTTPGTWEGNGQMSFRQVDPIHFEIMSIIADLEIKARSNR